MAGPSHERWQKAEEDLSLIAWPECCLRVLRRKALAGCLHILNRRDGADTLWLVSLLGEEINNEKGRCEYAQL
jgi:hypothetical protein